MTRYASPDEKVSFFTLPRIYPYMMKNSAKYKWFKPLLAVVLSAVFFLLFQTVFAILGDVLGKFGPQAAEGAYNGINMENPISLAGDLLGVASGILAVMIALKITGLGPLGRVSSVEGKLRWDRMKVFLITAFSVAILFNLIMMGIQVLTDGVESLGQAQFLPVTLLLVIVLVPFQCAAEEYLFRGVLMQTLSSWIPIIVIPLILECVAFGAMHGYSTIGLIATGCTGLVTGYLAIKTGGLEASISLHCANNVTTFLASAIFVSQTVQTEVSIFSFATSVGLDILFLIVLYWVAKRKGYLLADTKQNLEGIIEEPSESEAEAVSQTEFA